jgi:hypothetical protein
MYGNGTFIIIIIQVLKIALFLYFLLVRFMFFFTSVHLVIVLRAVKLTRK